MKSFVKKVVSCLLIVCILSSLYIDINNGKIGLKFGGIEADAAVPDQYFYDKYNVATVYKDDAPWSTATRAPNPSGKIGGTYSFDPLTNTYSVSGSVVRVGVDYYDQYSYYYEVSDYSRSDIYYRFQNWSTSTLEVKLGSQNSRSRQKTTLVQSNIIADDHTYPDNGEQDGYWYVKKDKYDPMFGYNNNSVFMQYTDGSYEYLAIQKDSTDPSYEYVEITKSGNMTPPIYVGTIDKYKKVSGVYAQDKLGVVIIKNTPISVTAEQKIMWKKPTVKNLYDKYTFQGPNTISQGETKQYDGYASNLDFYSNYYFNPATGKIILYNYLTTSSYPMMSSGYVNFNGTYGYYAQTTRWEGGTIYCYKFTPFVVNKIALSKDKLVEANITAYSGAFPDNGPFIDGYWYVNKGENKVPSILATSPSQNDIICDLDNYTLSMKVSDSSGDTLTCKYYIDSIEMETRTITNTTSGQVVTFNPPDLNSFSEGNHTIKFEVSDGYYAPVSQSVNVTIDKNPPMLSSVNFSSDNTSITISGNATDNVTDTASIKYRYTVGNIVSDWVSDTSYKISSLLPDTEYSCKFEASDKTGHIAEKEQRVRTSLQVPQIVILNNKQDSFNVLINDLNPPSVQYQVMVDSSYVNESGDLTPAPEWISPSGKNVLVNGLTPNTEYTVKAKAKNSDGIETTFSTGTVGTTLAAPPNNIHLESEINSIKITWDAVDSATGYDIEVDGRVSDAGITASFNHEDLQPETSHTYRVRVINSGGTGEWSDLVSGMTLPSPPDIPAISDTEASRTEIKITWDAVAKADGYEIEADGKVINTGTNTTFIDQDLIPDSSHTYRVRAKNAGGNSEWSNVKEVKTLPNPPETPEGLKANPTRTDVTLAWQEADRADGYDLEVDGQSFDVKTVKTYIHKELLANSQHTYRVRAYNNGGKSEWSEPVRVTTWPEIPDTPQNIIATAQSDSICLTWYSVNNAESYDVQIDGKYIENVEETACTNTGLQPGTKHIYRIRAKNISGEGQWSNVVEMETLPKETNTGTGSSEQKLANIAAVVTNKSITVTWQSLEPDSRYEIEVDGEIKDNGKDTVYTHTGLKPETFHTYRVRTKDANGNGQWCAILALSTLPDLPGAPTNISATAGNNQIELKWDRLDGTSYDIEIDGNVVDAGDAGGYTHHSLTPGTSHTYRVRGKNITGVTAWSDAISKSTTSPSHQVECIKNKDFSFLLFASDVQDFSGMTFTVTYNPEELDVTDLCQFTQSNETTSGRIPGTNLTVKYTPGKIEFTVDENINPGTVWSGEISTIVFKPKVNGKASIDFNVL